MTPQAALAGRLLFPDAWQQPLTSSVQCQFTQLNVSDLRCQISLDASALC